MCTDDAGNGADNGTTPRDLAALTPRCAAGPDRWSMGNPAHTATQGVNLRIQGPKHPPKGLTGSSHFGVWGVVLAWGRGLPDD